MSFLVDDTGTGPCDIAPRGASPKTKGIENSSKLGKMMKMFCCLGKGLDFPDDFSEHGGYALPEAEDASKVADRCPLVSAAKINQISEVRRLISEGVDPTQIDNVRTPTSAMLLALTSFLNCFAWLCAKYGICCPTFSSISPMSRFAQKGSQKAGLTRGGRVAVGQDGTHLGEREWTDGGRQAAAGQQQSKGAAPLEGRGQSSPEFQKNSTRTSVCKSRGAVNQHTTKGRGCSIAAIIGQSLERSRIVYVLACPCFIR
jgi:hypothetical protein